MMKNLIIATSLLFAISLISCKKVITVNLNNASPQLVIKGEVTNAAGPYQISINTTVNFSAPNTFPPVSGAQVTISDNTGINDSLTEIAPGVFATHSYWQGQPGNTYTLNVMVSGKNYTATSTMPPQVNLDSVGFQKVTNGRTPSIEAVAYFQDPPGVTNYYQFSEIINDTLLNKIFIFQDRLSDGKYISQPFDTDSLHLQPGNQLSFSMYSVDKNVYQYFSELRQLLNANPFNEATPANPGSNISGGALGYFSAHTLQTRHLTVPF